jgi:hypothetical protein
MSRLLGWPPPAELGEPVARDGVRPHPPQKPHTEAHADGWHARLLSDSEALAHAECVRGVLRETLRDWNDVGYGDSFFNEKLPPSFKFTVRDDAGVIVGLKEHWAKPWLGRRGKLRKSWTLSGEGNCWLWPLSVFSDAPAEVIVTEGEWKALALNQCGLAAVTSTGGTHWNREWNRYIDGRSVGVLYDAELRAVGIARKRAAEFCAAGADAYVIDLRRAGFRGKTDIGDVLVRHGADRVHSIVEQSRRGRAVA